MQRTSALGHDNGSLTRTGPQVAIIYSSYQNSLPYCADFSSPVGVGGLNMGKMHSHNHPRDFSLPAPRGAHITKDENLESRRGWVVQGRGLLMPYSLFFFSLAFLIEFEVVVFVSLRNGKRMKLRKYNGINSENPLPF